MYAIVETGGKQYKVSVDEIINVEKLQAKVGDKVELNALMIVDGEKVTTGNPYVEGKKVKAEVVEQGKAKKVIVFKYKAKKDYRRKQGHRQPYTKVEIKNISK